MHTIENVVDHIVSARPIVKFFNILEHQENEVAEALRDMEIHFTRCCTRLYRADLTYTERHVRFTYFDEATRNGVIICFTNATYIPVVERHEPETLEEEQRTAWEYFQRVQRK